MLQFYHDIDMYGAETASGKAVELYNSEAIRSAFVLWASSKAGDFLMNPEAGGVLDRLLFKNMDGKSIGMVLFSMKNALFNEFAPVIEIVDLQIEKDYVNRALEIKIIYKELETGVTNSTVIYTKDVRPIQEQTEQSIPYTGQNLYMFCVIKKPDMGSEILKYFSDESVWRWGIYKFTSFSESDTYYAQILEVCNS